MLLPATHTSLNGICPYFTMFPLEFPLKILQKRAKRHQSVLDPFCGRGTTNFAARLIGLHSLGVDSSPVAIAITAAKIVHVSTQEILAEARDILINAEIGEVPSGEFWEWAYHPKVLIELCRFRTALLKDCSTAPRIALRGIILGALHGPRQKTFQSYFSNQNPRTYAPKPAYATRFWKSRKLLPLRVDFLEIIERRAKRYYSSLPNGGGEVRLGDSREFSSLIPASGDTRFSWVITSPPYYGMRTYIPDQWLRNWFIGGADCVDYSSEYQVVHTSPDDFAADLRKVWNNAAAACTPDATLIVRFGGIGDRRVAPLELVKSSFRDSAWRLVTIRNAPSALNGRRQSDAFLRNRRKPVEEHDLWARLA